MTDAAPDRQHHGGHEEAPIDDGHAVRGAVAANMRRARLARGVSLREMSAATGLSTALLSQVEREAANPTVTVLVRIASFLELSFSDLTRVTIREPEIIRAEHPGGDGTSGLPRVRTLFDMLERRRFDISEGVLPPHQPGSFGAHGKGSIEHSYVVSGRVTLTIGDRRWQLGPHDAVRFDSSVPHAYSTGKSSATLLTVVTFQED
ncbi:MAG: XRE family transcriptional regulator [Ilumatobacteraceae bacterium]